ncbi:MAG: malate dehydrogenase (quinone) [Betaproteobacteria bacterium]|nr:malate dehydrogenase (quinone) [Betaproteobacteria bacterium]
MADHKVDILLIGSGIMSATLATLLSQLAPHLSMWMVEKLPESATESSNAWNNAGTGHAGYCELNYTPQHADGTIEINRALAINASYEVSLQFWASLIEKGLLTAPNNFINTTPHLSFVNGEANVAFLRRRHQLLSAHPLFQDMQYSENHQQLKTWIPLMMQGREASNQLAATRVRYGSDVDFGALTRQLIASLQNHADFDLKLNTEVTHLKQLKDSRWRVKLKHQVTNEVFEVEAGFVFVGAGGGALSLLQKSGIPEINGYGGFPVSGQWLVCEKEAIIQQHHSKVYGKAALGAPPMSVPHLDTRIINGKTALLFGPYAGFTTKFLKQGSFLDMMRSIQWDNLQSMLGAGWHHLDLTQYLIGEALQSHATRIETLRQFYPLANAKDWQLKHAGKRVQIIKKCPKQGGKLEFGTEIVSAQDGSIAGLLGASPGASVSVQAMLSVIERCFGPQLKTDAWQQKLKALIPSYGQSLIDDTSLLHQVRTHTLGTLNLQ